MLLGIDTCLRHLTLALQTAAGDIVSLSKPQARGHAETIAPALAGLLAEAGVPAAGLRRIGVTVGPGSFMGQRVGIAFAKGLALASGAETVPIGTLEAFAHQLGEPCDVALDARRGQAYWQRFPGGGAPRILSYEDVAQASGGGRLLAGDAGDALGLPSQGRDHILPRTLLDLTERLEAGPLRTLYLRAPDAKPARPLL